MFTLMVKDTQFQGTLPLMFKVFNFIIKTYYMSLHMAESHGTQIHSKRSRFPQTCCIVCINLHLHVVGNLGTYVIGIHWECMFLCGQPPPSPSQLPCRCHVTCHIGAMSFFTWKVCHVSATSLPHHHLIGKGIIYVTKILKPLLYFYTPFFTLF